MGDRTKHDIDFFPAVAIKRQKIEDFIVKLTQVDTSTTWPIEVDGLSCNVVARIGLRIITLGQRTYEHSILLQFVASNNVI